MSKNDPTGAPTLFLLMAQYQGKAVLPLETVRCDFFAHLSEEKLLRKCLRGEIALPIYRAETSQKSMRGVHLADLAKYVDERREAAIKECQQICGGQ